jgi:hypothetical protein
MTKEQGRPAEAGHIAFQKAIPDNKRAEHVLK